MLEVLSRLDTLTPLMVAPASCAGVGRDSAGIGRCCDGIAAADAKGAGLTIADAKLNVVEGAGVAGVEREVEGCGPELLVTPVCVIPPPKTPTVLESSVLRHEARGDEGECDGDVACAGRNESLRDGLVDQALIGVDDVLASPATL